MVRKPRRLLVVIAGALTLALVLLATMGFAVRQLRSRVEGALGPRASIGSIKVDWTGIDLFDLRIKGAQGWAAEDEMRARRVRITPDLRSVLGGHWHVSRVRIEDGYLSVVRTRDGRLLVLPALAEVQSPERRATKGEAASAAAPVEIGAIEFHAARIDFFDNSVREPALLLRLAQLEADVGPLVLPALDKPINVKLEGAFKGPQHDGHVAIDGSCEPATRNADVRARFTGLDVVALEPYLLKVAEAGVRRGTLDLELHATVVRNMLRAPGKLTLTKLELASDSSLATFAGLPRKAVLAAMTEGGKIEARFALEGRLDDPAFSLNENLATKLASGMAESLGVSLSGVVKGLSGMVRGLFGK